MANNGLAKGKNSGHITTPIESAPKANRRKGVSRLYWNARHNRCSGTLCRWDNTYYIYVHTSGTESCPLLNATPILHQSSLPTYLETRLLTSVPHSAVKSPVKYADLHLTSVVFLIWSKPEDLLLTSVFTNSQRGDLVATRELLLRERISRVLMLHRGPRLLEQIKHLW